MQSHERCSVVEVMGHRAGNLALYVGLAAGATAVLVPEEKWDFSLEAVVADLHALEVYANHAEAEVAKHATLVERMTVEQLDNYRQA